MAVTESGDRAAGFCELPPGINVSMPVGSHFGRDDPTTRWGEKDFRFLKPHIATGSYEHLDKFKLRDIKPGQSSLKLSPWPRRTES